MNEILLNYFAIMLIELHNLLAVYLLHESKY